MEAAREREHRLVASRRRRQSDALVAIKAAEMQVARDRQREGLRAKSGRTRPGSIEGTDNLRQPQPVLRGTGLDPQLDIMT